MDNYDFNLLNEEPDYTGNPFEAQYKAKIAEYEAALKAEKGRRIATNVASALVAGAIVGGISNIRIKSIQKKAAKCEDAAWDRGFEYGKDLTTYAARNYIDGLENGYKVAIQNRT